jgi:hypothetical protein
VKNNLGYQILGAGEILQGMMKWCPFWIEINEMGNFV